MSGPAGSGKSTWAKDYITSHPNTVIVASDAVRYDLFGSYNLNRQQERKVIPEMLQRISDASTKGQDVIIDVAICKNKSRIKWYNRIKNLYKEIDLVIIEVPIELALKRNQQRERHVPEYVIKDMYDIYERPSQEVFCKFTEVTVYTSEE